MLWNHFFDGIGGLVQFPSDLDVDERRATQDDGQQHPLVELDRHVEGVILDDGRPPSRVFIGERRRDDRVDGESLEVL